MVRGHADGVPKVADEQGWLLPSLPSKGMGIEEQSQGGRLAEGEGGVITIRAEESTESERGVTETIREVDGLERRIRTYYLFGTDTIVIDLGRRMTPAIRDQVKSAIQKLIGLEIVEEEANSMTIQCLLQPSSMPIKSTLKRAYILAASMHREAEQALVQGDEELAQSVSRRDDEVDRLYFLIVRQLRIALSNPEVAEKLGVGLPECLDLRMAAKYVETIADLSSAVAQAVPKLEGKEVGRELMDGLTRLSGAAYRIHEEAAQALFRQDVKLAEAVMNKNSELVDEFVSVNKLLSSRQPAVAALLDSVTMFFYQIGSHGIDLAELVSGARA
jgi:phosphate uptake regulator